MESKTTTDGPPEGSLADFLDTDARLRADALRIYSGDDMSDAMTVSRMLTRGATAIDAADEADEEVGMWRVGSDGAARAMPHRLRSLFDFLCSWRRRTAAGELDPIIPPLPDGGVEAGNAGGGEFFAALIGALMACDMFATVAGRAFNLDGAHGHYREERYATAWLNDGADCEKWTRWELMALASLSARDYADDAATVVGMILSEIGEADDPLPYGVIARRVSESPEVAIRGGRRLRESGAVEVTSSGKVSFWRLAPHDAGGGGGGKIAAASEPTGNTVGVAAGSYIEL